MCVYNLHNILIYSALNLISLIVIIDYYRRLNPSLVKVLEPNWDQNLFLAPKISYLCRKEILSYEVDVFS